MKPYSSRGIGVSQLDVLFLDVNSDDLCKASGNLDFSCLADSC